MSVMSAFSIVGKKCILTGGARGLGEGCARALIQAGASVAIFDVRDELGEKVAAEATQQGPGKAHYFHVDLTSRTQIVSSVDLAVQALGGLDSVLNIAGVEGGGLAEEIPEELYDFVMNVNVKGTFLMAQAAFPHLKERGGTVINFGSDVGLIPLPKESVYSASKGAVHSLTRTLAHEWGKHNIRVNAVLPTIKSELNKEYLARLTPEEVDDYTKSAANIWPLRGEKGEVKDDLAPVIIFLVSEASRYITSQLVPVNGGAGQVR